MEKYIAEFPEQLNNAVRRVEDIPIYLQGEIKNIVIAGMGGSGIAGDFVKEYADYRKSEIPIIVHKSNFFPNYINEHTLFIASSYSGNTEETLSVLRSAIHRKAKVVGITSGGEMEKICKEHNCPVLILPQGFPPRTAIAYSMAAMLHVLSQKGVIFFEWIGDFHITSNILDMYQKEIRPLAKEIAQKIHNTFPIIYSSCIEAIALRMRQQLNENSKILCSHHVIPEMNHNELVGWKKLNAPHSVIMLHTDYTKYKNEERINFCKNVFSELNVPVIEILPKGDELLTQWLYHVNLADWISYELALLNNVDPMEVKVIDNLKEYIKSHRHY